MWIFITQLGQTQVQGGCQGGWSIWVQWDKKFESPDNAKHTSVEEKMKGRGLG